MMRNVYVKKYVSGFVYVKFISPPHSSAPFFNLQPSSRHYQRISTSLFVDVHIPGLGHRNCDSCPHHIISQCFDMDFNLLRLFSLSLSLSPSSILFTFHTSASAQIVAVHNDAHSTYAHCSHAARAANHLCNHSYSYLDIKPENNSVSITNLSRK